MQGIGTLTLTSPATFTSSLSLNDIAVCLDGPNYSAPMLGTGTLSFVGSGASLINTSPSIGGGSYSTSEFSNPVSVAAGQTGSILFSQRTVWNSANVSGAGTLNLFFGSTIPRDDLYSNFASFTGQVNVVGTIAGSGIRYFLSGGAAGSANALWNIGSAGTPTVALYPQTVAGGNTMNIGALSGGVPGTLGGGSEGVVTYSIGALGNNTTFPGSITGNAAVTKVGSGTLILSGSCNYTGATSVLGGVLELTGSLSSSSSLTVASGAVFCLASGSLSVSGMVTNNGIFKISGTPSLALTGSFINNGVLDLINGAQTLPVHFINNGTVLDASSVHVQHLAMSGSNFTLTVQGYAQHTYQLQRTASILPSRRKEGISRPMSPCG
jgi:autotransporter-associated beta strand protein